MRAQDSAPRQCGPRGRERHPARERSRFDSGSGGTGDPRCGLQACRTKAVLPRGGLRHGKAERLGVAPAAAVEVALEGGAAARAAQAARREGRAWLQSTTTLPWSGGFEELRNRDTSALFGRLATEEAR